MPTPGPAVVNIEFYRGAARVFRFGPILDEDDVVQDVDGWTGTFTMRTRASAEDPVVYEKDWAVASPSVDGYVTVTISSADSLALDARKYVYSVERTNTGFEDLIAIGDCDVLLDVFHEA